jgi:uncharacterized protein YcgL (UPF0745 family)
MILDIHRSLKQSNVYVFVKQGVKPDSLLPDEVKSLVGELQLHKSLDINKEDPPRIVSSWEEVLSEIASKQYSIQQTKQRTNNISEVGVGLGAGIIAASLGATGLWPVGWAIAGFAIARKMADSDNQKEKESDEEHTL